MIAALLLAATTPVALKIDAVAMKAGLAGEVLVGRGGRIVQDRAYGTVDPAGGSKHKVGALWRLASITKQVTAAITVREVQADGLAALDEPQNFTGASDPILRSFTGLTIRQMLTHHTGLANPDDTAVNADGVPVFYTRVGPPTVCLSKVAQPGAPFRYNNCDYLMLPTPTRWPAGMRMARPGEIGVRGFVMGRPEPAFELATFGAAGGLMGTARAVFNFDRSLMSGKLLTPVGLSELWRPEGHGSYQALGQWVFPGTLKGCAAPKRIVQRDGEIWGVQTRNFILPDDDLVVIVFTNRSSDDFKLGEVWEGRGFIYDLLSAVVCP